MTREALRRHWSSAFSRGPGYESTPPGHQLGGQSVSGYYVDFGAKTTSASADAPGTLLPAAMAQLALGWWERSLAGEPGAEGRFVEACELLARAGVAEGEAVIWLYRIPLAKYRLEPPWISALAQAQAASVFVRAFLRSGEPRHRELALAAARPLLQTVSPTVVAALPAGPALEECPTAPPSLILNGWIYAIWGLRDVALGLGSDAAASTLEATTACLVSMLPQYDTGWWTRYSLFPFKLPDLAKPFYHRLHVAQLEVMHRLTGEPVYGELAARWRGYDRPARRAALVAQKAAFVTSRYR
jgi:heparosan-N-sulfate-glucuronate 5-epimerase